VVIHGTDDTANAVITLLARHHITARQLRVVEAGLDDVFLDLTEQAT
jgi:ABC-2 type transport system ATP-binding protein